MRRPWIVARTGALLACFLVTGCVRAAAPAAGPPSLEAPDEASEIDISAREVQAVVFEMADDYIATLGEAIYLTTERVREDKRARWLSQSFLRNGVGAALDIAVDPNPDIALLDMVVLVSLQRWAFEAHWIPAGIGDEGGAFALERMRDAEALTWRTAGRVLSESQCAELRRLIEAWIEANPGQTVVSFVRFDEFTDDRMVPDHEDRGRASRLLREWRETVTAVEEAVLLAERAIWFAGRYPYVLGEQAELTAYRLAAQPEFADLERALASVVALERTLGGFAERLPEDPMAASEAAISRLSDAAVDRAFERIAQERTTLLAEVESRKGELGSVLAELRETLGASSALAKEASQTLETLDRVLARFQPRSAEYEEPLELREIRELAVETGRTAETLTGLLEQTNKTLESSHWDDRIAGLQSLTTGVLDRAFWRVLALVVILLGGLALVRRIPRRR